MLEVNRLIAEVKEKDDVRILPGDPAFALVTLNQLTLEDLARRLLDGVRAAIEEFNGAIQKTEARAGTALAYQVKAAASVFRQELHKDIESARLNSVEIVNKVDKCHRNTALLWVGLGFLVALVAMFGAGVWTGFRLR